MRAAFAALPEEEFFIMRTSKFMLVPVAAAATLLAMPSQAQASGTQINVDLTGVQSFNGYSNALNTILTVNIGVGNFITGIGWDARVSTVGASYASEATITIRDTLAPFVANGYIDLDIFATSFSTGNFSDTLAVQKAPFTDGRIFDAGPVLADALGNVYIEFWESFNDSATGVDANWGGSLTLQVAAVPAPGALALLGLAGVVSRRRRRS